MDFRFIYACVHLNLEIWIEAVTQFDQRNERLHVLM